MEEKVFTINLRKDGLNTTRQRKSKRASSAVREYLIRHMKADEIKIGESINQQIWARGNQKPPARIKIKVIKTDDGVVKAEMWGHVFEEELKEPKKKETPKEEKSKADEKKAEAKEEDNKEGPRPKANKLKSTDE